MHLQHVRLYLLRDRKLNPLSFRVQSSIWEFRAVAGIQSSSWKKSLVRCIGPGWLLQGV